MTKSVLISIKPKWCELIANRHKTIEVRKTKPKIDTPFKCYIYCTKPSKKYQTVCGCMVINTDELYRHPVTGIKHDWSGELMCLNTDYGDNYTYNENNFLNGKVIGEFVCDEIEEIKRNVIFNAPALFSQSCLERKEFYEYIGKKAFYCWHISDLKIYDNPKELSEFYHKCDWVCGECEQWSTDCKCTSLVEKCRPLKRPPQSWQYVEGI